MMPLRFFKEVLKDESKANLKGLENIFEDKFKAKPGIFLSRLSGNKSLTSL